MPEDLARALGDDEVDVSLAIACLGVGETVPLLRQRPERAPEPLEVLDRAPVQRQGAARVAALGPAGLLAATAALVEVTVTAALP